MPQTTNLVILSPNAGLAVAELTDILHNKAHVLIIVLGGDETAHQTALRADQLSGPKDDPLHRVVVWGQKPDAILPTLKTLDVVPGVAFPGDDVPLTLAVSRLQNRVSDALFRTADANEPTIFRLFLAYVAAEAQQ